MKVIIIGGVAGGASAAARLRRIDENCEIIIFERGEYISFANCGLPYYIGDVITDKGKLLVQTPQAMKQRFNIDVRILCEVLSIDPEKKEVEILDHNGNRKYNESYDKLILSPGASPIKPNIEGVDGRNVFTLRNIPDTYAIREFVDNNQPKMAVVVGGGFIGLEIAENLHAKGVNVAIVEMANQVLGPIDPEMAALVHSYLKEKQVELYLGDGLKSIKHTEKWSTVELNSGKCIKADIIILGIGVRPETQLAKTAGLEIGERGGIKVDRLLRTSNPDIYAVGDAVEIIDFVNGKPAVVPLAGPANKQGRIAANNICGLSEEYTGTQGTSVLKVFDMTVASTGNNEKILGRLNIPYEKSFTHSVSHAGYYPGSTLISIKLLFSPVDGKILGAQAVGYDGVEKRIDVLATAIRAGMTVYDLEKLELSYAPPYSSAKDPVNIAGYTASNILKGDCCVVHWDEIAKLNRDNTLLVDVRTEMEFSLGTLAGAVNIPVDEIRARIDEIPRDKDIVIFCQIGLRGYIACRILMQNGYNNVRNLSGGYKTYKPAVQDQSNTNIFDYDEIACSHPALAPDIKDDIKPKCVTLDACGLQCPGPIMQVNHSLSSMNDGELLEVTATDPAFGTDITTWCERTGNQLLEVKREDKKIRAMIRKGNYDNESNKTSQNGGNDKTMVVFSGELDKAIASFIIANGAAAMGRKVTMFFTFWGLNILRKHDKVNVKKNLLEKMFGMMMPRGSKKLGLSKMNMGGMGSKMIRYIMKEKNISSLEDLILQAKSQGVRIVACSMSMDVMGIKEDELIEGVEVGGVATFLGSAELSDTNLFI
jgi:CoA-disulfide reductase